MAHDLWVNPFHVGVFLGEHVQLVFKEGGDCFSKLLGQIFSELEYLRWFLVIDWEVDLVLYGPSGSLFIRRPWVNGVIEGSLTWRPLIDDIDLPWSRCTLDGLVVKSPCLFLISSYLPHSI